MIQYSQQPAFSHLSLLPHFKALYIPLPTMPLPTTLAMYFTRPYLSFTCPACAETPQLTMLLYFDPNSNFLILTGNPVMHVRQRTVSGVGQPA